MKRMLWLGSFGLAAPLGLVASFLLLAVYMPKSPEVPVRSPQVLSAYTQIYQAKPEVYSQVPEVVPADARPLIVKNYLIKYNSPLEPFYQTVVDISDKYQLDYRLLVAIAQQESNLCKRIPENSFNCWGFGIYGDKVTRFGSYDEALDTVARTLKKNYIDKGLNTTEEIMAKYTPPSLATGGSWAKGVNQFLAELQ